MARMTDALRSQLDNARGMRDDAAVRALRATIAAIENVDDEVAAVRAEIDHRSRAASQVAATDPDAAQRLRHEAEILTIVLAQAGH